MQRICDGYVAESSRGLFLTEAGFWVGHVGIDNAHVHSAVSLKSIDWSSRRDKPARLYPAKRIASKTVILGLPVDLREIMNI